MDTELYFLLVNYNTSILIKNIPHATNFFFCYPATFSTFRKYIKNRLADID
jgi:hypothetical protein